MRNFLLGLLLVAPSILFSQSERKKWPRAFPITNYIVDLNDSIKVVQVKLPAGTTFAEKQIGLLRGSYREKPADTSIIGIGRCYLIKGEYYYFTINFKQSGILPREGDLIYAMAEKPTVYTKQIVPIAGHFIGLQNVYEVKWFDRYTVFSKWSAEDEKAIVDSIVKDIHFTANYFLENNPSMNVKIIGGRNDGKLVLNTMTTCTAKDVTDFFDYMLARPRLYAGHEWKTSEIYGTWLKGGAPTVK
jgi:hypothetical protein